MFTRAALIVAATAAPALAQVISYSGGLYQQDFRGLASSGNTTLSGKGPHYLEGVLGSTDVNGWYGANFGGSSNDTEVRAQDGSLGSSAGRGVNFFGTTGSAERALGCLPTSNQISSIGALLANDTGGILTEVTIVYTGEQWRRGNVSTPNILSFAYGFGSSISDATTPFAALDFISPNMQGAPTEVGIDGNDPANQVAFNQTIKGLNWAPGQTLAIRWNINDISGQDNGLSIDNFSFRAAPTPGTAGLLVLGLAAMHRRRK